MDKQSLINKAADFVDSSADNYISGAIAISAHVAGMKIFEHPILAFGSPGDHYFTIFKEPSVIGEHFMLPREWLPEVKTVISFFLPFTTAVKKAIAGIVHGHQQSGFIDALKGRCSL